MSVGFTSTGLRRMHRVLAEHVENGRVPGLVTLLSRKGEVNVDAVGLMAKGGAPLQRDTLFRIASITKPIAAVGAMILVEECRVRLDEPVDRLLPELANRRVLKRIDGPLDETVPAERPITLRDLLTLRMGLGYIMLPGEFPIMTAAQERGFLLGPPRPDTMPAPDEWLRRLGELPLMHQPGTTWQYDLGLDILGVLISRAAGRPLDVFLKERVFEPLAMKDTAFSVPPSEIGRLATSYDGDDVYDLAEGGAWSKPPAFCAAASGLVSTADDLLALGRMMLVGGEPLLARPTVLAMTTDALSEDQKQGNEMFFGTNKGWGFGMSVFTRRDDISASPGRFGWDGGLGTSWYCDPAEDLIGILMTQQSWNSPEPPPVWLDFWTTAYAALEN